MNLSVRSFAKLSLVFSLVALTGCETLFGHDGYFRNRGDDYLKSEALEPLKVPDDLEYRPQEELYRIPPVTAEDTSAFDEQFDVPRPQTLAANQGGDLVKIQKLGERRWVLVGTQPSEVWPRIRAFMAANGLVMALADTRQGLIETAWLEFSDNTSIRHKYRIQVDRGVQPDTAEIHIRQVSRPAGDTPEQISWPERSTDAGYEDIMINELAGYLASDVTGVTSLMAQGIGGSTKVRMLKIDGEPALAMELDFTRAWATIGFAIEKDGYVRFDESMSNSIYYIGYADPDDDGFWGIGGAGTPETDYTLEQLMANLTFDKAAVGENLFVQGHQPIKKVPGYLLVFTGTDGDLTLRIRDGYGQPLSKREAKQLLAILRRNLI